MAGICGYYFKGNSGAKNHASVATAMLHSLGKNEPTFNFLTGNGKVFLGEKKQNYISENGNPERLNFGGLKILTEGLIFIPEMLKKEVDDNYHLSPGMDTIDYLPYLFHLHGNGVVEHFSGNFNLVVYDEAISKLHIFNDKLGFLPLFVYSDSKVIVFASKIDSIVKSGLMQSIEIDDVSIIEQLLFNYNISDNTLVKNIETLPPASCIEIYQSTIIESRYWDEKVFFKHQKPLKKLDSFDLLNQGLNNAVEKVIRQTKFDINFTLTGGWDSRVLLSYLMKSRERLSMFSFGAPGSDDIIVPQLIANSLDIKYTPFILDDNYLENKFIDSAIQTIIGSNGTRNYKRSHYLYASANIGVNSPIVVNGIFGDEVLKIAGPKPGNVISKSIVDYFNDGLNIEKILQSIEKQQVINHFATKYSNEELVSRLGKFEDRSSDLDMPHRFYHFRFFINLRKYFGFEANSYNDSLSTFSPFVDIDFLDSYFRGHFCGIFYPFNSGSLKLKFETTKLYANLINANFAQLAKFPSNRGYSMSDAANPFGFAKILVKQVSKKNRQLNEFNTLATDDLFKKYLMRNDESILSNKYSMLMKGGSTEKSLLFWIARLLNA